MFVFNSYSYQSINRFNCYLKVTTASQEAVKARSYRGIVQPRHVVPRLAVPKRKRTNRKGTARLKRVESNYQHTFNDEFWPDMWYFVSMKRTFNI